MPFDSAAVTASYISSHTAMAGLVRALADGTQLVADHGSPEDIILAAAASLRHLQLEDQIDALADILAAMRKYQDEHGAGYMNVTLSAVGAHAAPPMQSGKERQFIFFGENGGAPQVISAQKDLSLAVHAPQGAAQHMGAAFPRQNQRGLVLQIAQASASDTKRLQSDADLSNPVDLPGLDELVEELANAEWRENPALQKIAADPKTRADLTILLRAMPPAPSAQMPANAQQIKVVSALSQLQSAKSAGTTQRRMNTDSILPKAAPSMKPAMTTPKAPSATAPKFAAEKMEITRQVLTGVLGAAISRMETQAVRTPQVKPLQDTLRAGYDALMQPSSRAQSFSSQAMDKITEAVSQGIKHGDAELRRDLRAVESLRVAMEKQTAAQTNMKIFKPTDGHSDLPIAAAEILARYGTPAPVAPQMRNEATIAKEIMQGGKNYQAPVPVNYQQAQMPQVTLQTQTPRSLEPIVADIKLPANSNENNSTSQIMLSVAQNKEIKPYIPPPLPMGLSPIPMLERGFVNEVVSFPPLPSPPPPLFPEVIGGPKTFVEPMREKPYKETTIPAGKDRPLEQKACNGRCAECPNAAYCEVKKQNAADAKSVQATAARGLKFDLNVAQPRKMMTGARL